MNGRLLRALLLGGLAALCTAQTALADKTHSQTSRANRHYDREQYDQALDIYDQTLLEAPQEHRLHANRGSALYKLNRLDEADTAYQRALQLKDRSALADIHYSRGNALYRQGEAMTQSGGQNAMEKFKAALSEYAQALDLRSNDKDAKWNLQLAYNRIQQMQQQQQNQKQNKDNQDQKQDQKQNQDQQNKQDQQKQDEQQDKQNQQQPQDQKQNEEGKEKQQPQPQPQNQEEQMKKAEAARLIRQFADDDKNLNKPEKMVPAGEARPEKDW